VRKAPADGHGPPGRTPGRPRLFSFSGGRRLADAAPAREDAPAFGRPRRPPEAGRVRPLVPRPAAAGCSLPPPRADARPSSRHRRLARGAAFVPAADPAARAADPKAAAAKDDSRFFPDDCQYVVVVRIDALANSEAFKLLKKEVPDAVHDDSAEKMGIAFADL